MNLQLHDDDKNPLYRSWRNMKRRCYNTSYIGYEYYGGRGIAVCDEWLNDFDAFHDWSINNNYAVGLTLDRIDVNKDYSPDNCRWVTWKVQNNNTRFNHLITFKGVTKTLTEWCEALNLPRDPIYTRLNKLGWSVERALTTPIKVYRKVVKRHKDKGIC